LLTEETASLVDFAEFSLAQDEAQAWGSAAFRIAAYAENSWDLVPLSGVAFGDVTLRNLATPTPLRDLTVMPAQGVNVRALPSDMARVQYAAAQGDVVKAVARLEDNTWVQVASLRGETGWVRADAFTDDLASLPIFMSDEPVTVDTALPYTRLQTTATSLTCLTSNVRGGVLLQVPSESPNVTMSINGIDMLFNGSVWVQAIPLEAGTATVVHALQSTVEVTIPQGDLTIGEGEFAVFFGALGDTTSEVTGELPTPTPFDGIELAELPVYLLPEPFYIPVDITRVLQPRPEGDISPLDGMLATAPCRITTGEGGSNIRAGAGTNYPIQAVMGFRESADVLGRATGSDGQNWWNIGPYLWVSGQTTVTGGDCAAVGEMAVAPVR
jgi:uncharacterized protein YraI